MMYGAVSALIGETRPFPGQCIRPWGCFFWGSIRKKAEGGRSEAKKFSVFSCEVVLVRITASCAWAWAYAPCAVPGPWPMVAGPWPPWPSWPWQWPMAHRPMAHGPRGKGQGSKKEQGAREQRAMGFISSWEASPHSPHHDIMPMP
jgi:hypothetical protein